MKGCTMRHFSIFGAAVSDPLHGEEVNEYMTASPLSRMYGDGC
eukprot:CAMPEP_0176419220 /NCGR_PEP_ID=MMETSP0127-20121128/7921_1 /TAXON_ID=938130 /ORGANISM="Platyophrya macrostoma, Strain WH" /LENGTH=42 /DNA_ID= /DNA_START= /DNA_END= /DNA_ORIENTATION=